MTARLPLTISTVTPARVMSVSPLSADALEPEPIMTTTVSVSASPPEEASAKRRALDARDHDNVDAQAIAERLSELCEQAANSESQSRQSIKNLQERLSVSARMLQAFQSQIVRIESGIAAFEKKHEAAERTATECEAMVQKQTAAAEQRLDDALEHFRTRLDETAKHAAEQFHQQMQRRMQDIEKLEHRIASLTEQATTAVHTVEQAESTVVPLVHRSAAIAQGLDERTGQVQGLIEQCQVEADVLAAQREQCEAVQQQMAVRMDEIRTTAQQVELDVQACEALENLLEQLQPWKAIMFQPTTLDEERAQGRSPTDELPQPLQKLLREVRSHVTGDMAELAGSLRAMAARVEQLAE